MNDTSLNKLRLDLPNSVKPFLNEKYLQASKRITQIDEPRNHPTSRSTLY